MTSGLTPASGHAPTATVHRRLPESFPAALAAAAMVVVYGLDALVVHPSGDLRPCPTAGLSRLAHWDATWYLSIAGGGYFRHPGPQQPSAFFPLFPFVARLVHEVTRLSLTSAGLAVNVTAVVGAMILVDRTIRDWPAPQRVGCVLALLCVPGAYFYVTFYSEALFAFGLALFMWALRRDRLWVAALAVVVASLDRTIGIVLVVPLTIVSMSDRNRREALALIAASCSGVVGFGVYVVASEKLALFRDARGGWRGLGGLSYPVYLVRHGVGQTARLVGRAGSFRRVVDTPSIGDSVVWGIGLYADAVIVAVLAFMWRRGPRHLVLPGVALGVATLALGPAISQERFAAVLLPVWVGAVGVWRHSTRFWLVLGLMAAGGALLNLHLMGQFAACRWAG